MPAAPGDWRSACADAFDVHARLFGSGPFDPYAAADWRAQLRAVREKLKNSVLPSSADLPEDPSSFQPASADVCHVRECGPAADADGRTLRPWQRLICLTYPRTFAAVGSLRGSRGIPEALAEVMRISGRTTRIDLVRLGEIEETVAEHDCGRI
ncbi:hypothetical protein SAE02_61380 [Skermanella aerolata]|uniref:Uncharacterized protein n=1 Tax=Skermanella aerolata TaxID=393310 RepID=A0A512E0M1_9PROT|nr:hypothetical protein [Skermanella aerolata]KJB91903.1 hypothetical protein N826_25640 [Skermanella aerolata KACC 11604]GEO41990.1 hypothetical protein SAE02_61380 [Skermanella aerolata]